MSVSMESNGTLNGVNNEFIAGSTVKGVKDNGSGFEGEVVSFHSNIGWLVIQQKSKRNPKNVDVTILTMKNLKEIQTVKVASKQDTSLPLLSTTKMEKRRVRNIESMTKIINRVGDGVSEYAQNLFDHLSKTISDVTWDKQDIVVMNSVVITPPYEVPTVRAELAGDQSETVLNKTLTYVSKVMNQFTENEAVSRRSAETTATSPVHVSSSDIRVRGD